MKAEGVVARRGQIISTKIEKYFANSEGSRIYQDLAQTGAQIVVAAKGPSGIHRRSEQQYALEGYELIDAMDLPVKAPVLANEFLELTRAQGLKEERRDVITSADQLDLQVNA